MDDYLKEQGLIGVGGWFKRNFVVPVRADFMQKVTRAIRTFDPLNKNEADRALLNNPHIAKAANAYADAFQKWAVKLKELGIDLKILQYIGYRIPTQGLNSIESMEIRKFLHPSSGDTIVVPSGIVAKAGSDFDIDKLNTYLKNVYVDAKGSVQEVPFFGFGEEAKAAIRNSRKAAASLIYDSIKSQNQQYYRHG